MIKIQKMKEKIQLINHQLLIHFFKRFFCKYWIKKGVYDVYNIYIYVIHMGISITKLIKS